MLSIVAVGLILGELREDEAGLGAFPAMEFGVPAAERSDVAFWAGGTSNALDALPA